MTFTYNYKLTLLFSETLYKDAVHYWPMDEIVKPSSENTLDNLRYIKDAKSNHTGVLHRTSHVQGQVKKALEIDGNGSVKLGNFANTCLGMPSLCDYGMTVSLWLKYRLSDQGRQYFLGTSGSDIRQPGFVIYQDSHANDSNYIAVSVRTDEARWTTHMTIPSGTWTHVLFTWSVRDGLTAYTNGKLASTINRFSPTTFVENAHATFTLGRANNEETLSRASYDELAVWYVILTSKEVKAIYARTSGIDFAALDAKTIQGTVNVHGARIK